MPVCCVRGCKSRNTKQSDGSKVSFFRFPSKNLEQQQLWISALGMNNWRPKLSTRICSLHFSQTDFIIDLGYQKVQLKPNSVPSLYLPNSLCINTDTDCNNENMQLHPNLIETIEIQQIDNVQLNQEAKDDDIPQTPVVRNCVEDSDESHIEIMKKMKQNSLMEKVTKLSHTVKILKQKIRRRDRKIKNLISLLDIMKEKKLIDMDPYLMLKNKFEGTSLDLFMNQVRNNTAKPGGCRYSNEVKEFALSLHYNSPKAYNFCRGILKLPHPSSLRNWMSSVNAEPGFQTDVFSELSKLQLQDRDCNLVLDGMALRKQIMWNKQKNCFMGYCNYGNNIDIEGLESEASEALVFMLVSLNGKWKWPVGYFFQSRMTALTQAELLKTCLTLSREAGLKVWAVTCDGCSVNYNMFSILGCNLRGTYSDINYTFKHPTAEYDVHVIFDACHMLKLARNAFATLQVLQSSKGFIKWQYIVNLHSLQKSLTLKFKNRLSSQCIAWENNKMKVKYAAQTLSASVANSLQFLQSESCQGFEDCAATIQFLQIIDRLFDFLNSRSPFGTGFKEPLKPSNLMYLEQIMSKNIQYLYELRDNNGRLLFTSQRKMFIYGFTTAVKSVISIAKCLFVENPMYKYLLTYKFSQDHIELLFARIRSRYGWNNNPNVMQFQCAMRQNGATGPYCD